jgi:hypothetical protein
MAHTFPPKAFAPAEVADPDSLNEPLQEAAAKLGGRVNEQDVSAEVTGKIPIADGAYYGAVQVVKSVAPNWNVAAGHYASIDGAGPDAAATILESPTWQSVVDDGTNDALSVDVTCGEGDQLVVFSLCQHVSWDDGDTTLAALWKRPLMLQYAVQLDGVLQDNSVTGSLLWPDPPPQEWYRVTPTSGNEYDWRHILRVQNTYGVSSAVHPTRMLHTVPVPAGTHTVSVAARVLPRSDYNAEVVSTVQVFNRRLFVLQIRGSSPGTGSAPSVLVDAFDDGHVVSVADIGANTFGELQTALNAVADENIERGALRHEHLTSVVYDPQVTLATPGAPTTPVTGEYPGYGVVSAAWQVIDAGGGGFFRIDHAWNFVLNPGVFVVLANVQVKYAGWNTVASNNNQAIGILCLRFTNNVGGVTVLGETEVCVNGHNFTNDGVPNTTNIEDDLPLMWVVDTRTLPVADRRISRIEVVGAVWDGAAGVSPPPVRMDTYRGMICAFGLKGLSL